LHCTVLLITIIYIYRIASHLACIITCITATNILFLFVVLWQTFKSKHTKQFWWSVLVCFSTHSMYSTSSPFIHSINHPINWIPSQYTLHINIASHHITSHHITSHHITWQHTYVHVSSSYICMTSSCPCTCNWTWAWKANGCGFCHEMNPSPLDDAWNQTYIQRSQIQISYIFLFLLLFYYIFYCFVVLLQALFYFWIALTLVNDCSFCKWISWFWTKTK
jgi:hypothetical protein